MPVKDYYSILGLTPQATTADVRTAYRRLAKQYHPDTNPDDKYALARFSLIKEAYEVLIHPGKKQSYIEERWLTRFHAGNYDTDGPVTPETVLKRVLQYEKHVLGQDYYRMNKEAAAAEAASLLNPDAVTQLLHFNDQAANTEIVRSMLRIAPCLAYIHSGELMLRLRKLAANDVPLLHEIERAGNRQYRQYRWSRYHWVAAVATALLLMGFLFWFTSGGR